MKNEEESLLRRRRRRRDRLHGACCCPEVDRVIYSFCSCGRRWPRASTMVNAGKWLVLTILDVATIAISIALVIRSEDNATDDQKNDVYTSSLFGFVIVVLELPLIILLLRGVASMFHSSSMNQTPCRILNWCCCSREAFQWMLYGRQAFWFFEVLALLRVRCAVDPFLINIPDLGLDKYGDSLETCADLTTNTTNALMNSTNVSTWLYEETNQLPSLVQELFNLTKNSTEFFFSDCNCTLNVTSSCEPATLPDSFPDMAGCSYLGLQYESFEQAESLGLAFLAVYTVQIIIRILFMLLLPGLCCSQRDDSALASVNAEIHLEKFENAMLSSKELRDAVKQSNVRYVRELCRDRNLIFVDTMFPPMPSSIGQNRLDRDGRERLRDSYLTLQRVMTGRSRLKRCFVKCCGRCFLGVVMRFILPIFPARLHFKITGFSACDPVFARANELHGGTHKIRLFMKDNDQAVLARRESRLQVSRSHVQVLRPPLNPNVPVSSVGVSQGHRGDCWFVAAITSLAHLRPDAIARLFEPSCPDHVKLEHEKKESKIASSDNEEEEKDENEEKKQQSYNQEGVYGVWLFWNGEWKHQLIDDWFPCTPMIDGTLEPVGAKILLDKNEKTRPTATMELWVALLEKAAAKLAGSYTALDGGGVFEALRTLTGSPCTILTRDTESSDHIWNELLRLRRDGCVMVASPSKQAPDVGLTRAHLYGIIDVHRNKQSGVRFVRVQNPWGFSKYSGPFAVSSFAWDSSIRRELRAKIPRKVIRITKQVTRDENGKLGIKFTKGLVLTELSEHAKKLGLQTGLRILVVNGVNVETQEQVIEALTSNNSVEIVFENRSNHTSQGCSNVDDLDNQHGSFWMDFRDFVMCFEKICVAHVRRQGEKVKRGSREEEKEEVEETQMSLSARQIGLHGILASEKVKSRCRMMKSKQPHRFGFGLWGRDVSLENDGNHVTSLYEVSSLTTIEVSVLLEYVLFVHFHLHKSLLLLYKSFFVTSNNPSIPFQVRQSEKNIFGCSRHGTKNGCIEYMFRGNF